MPHAKRKFDFGHAHVIGAERAFAAVRDHPFRQQPSCERAIHADMRLTGGAGGSDLPSEQRCGRPRLKPGLNCIAFGAVRRADRFGQLIQSRAPVPVFHQKA